MSHEILEQTEQYMYICAMLFFTAEGYSRIELVAAEQCLRTENHPAFVRFGF